MSISSDSAEQTIRLTLEGMEIVAKISGMAVKNIAVALYTISQDKKQTKGKTRLNNMLKSDNELKIFSVNKDEIKTFCQEAKSYGILYCALVNRRNKNIDNMIDIMVRAKDAPKINRIVERFNLSVHDKANIETTIDKERTNKNVTDLSENAPDIGEERTEVNDEMIDDIFSKPKENENQNPTAAKTEKSPPSEHSSMSKNNSEGVTKPVEKESVKKKLNDAKAELKVETELKQSQKPVIENVLNNNKDINITFPTTKKERGK